MVNQKELYPESEGWETIPDLDNAYRPENIGDTVKGVYVKHESDVGVNHSEVYTLHEENEEDPENPIVHIVYGTTDLNNKFEEINIGEEVGIIYKGSRPSKPPNKPFKKFIVKKRKLQNEEDNDMIMGDPIAVKLINDICNDIISEGKQPTEEQIKQKAKDYHIAHEEGFEKAEVLSKIDKQLSLKG